MKLKNIWWIQSRKFLDNVSPADVHLFRALFPYLKKSFADPFHFDTDPVPRIRFMEKRTRIRSRYDLKHRIKLIFSWCRYLIKDMQFGDVKNKKGGKLQLGYGLTCQVSAKHIWTWTDMTDIGQLYHTLVQDMQVQDMPRKNYE